MRHAKGGMRTPRTENAHETAQPKRETSPTSLMDVLGPSGGCDRLRSEQYVDFTRHENAKHPSRESIPQIAQRLDRRPR